MEVGKYYVIKGSDKDGEGFVCEAMMSMERKDDSTYWMIAESALDSTVFETVEAARSVMEIVKSQSDFTSLEVGCVTMNYEKVC